MGEFKRKDVLVLNENQKIFKRSFLREDKRK